MSSLDLAGLPFGDSSSRVDSFLKRRFGGSVAWVFLVCGLGVFFPRALFGAEAPVEFFENRIRPLLVENCYECHSAEKKTKGGLRLDVKEGWAHGGDSGPALVPGEPKTSLLMKAVRYEDPDLQMPPKRRLSASQVADLEEWIKMGAPDPRDQKASPAISKQTGLSIEEGKKFWSYQTPKATVPPKVKKASWPRNGIDRFLLSEMGAKGLEPAADADSVTLVRRAFFDLTGLPPTPEEIRQFEQDASPEAFSHLVERLLAAPAFGEHWGRHWLDVARFGESVTLRGIIIKDAWNYRDYVIGAFNQDMPFDQFVKEQIAGDLLPHRDVSEHRRHLIAALFLMLGNTNLEEQDKKQLDMDVVDEQLDTIGKAFLGQTIGCARCHDHKFDPIPTRDYYAMAGILKNSQALKHANVSGWVEVPMPVSAEEETVLQKKEKAIAALQAEMKTAKAELQAASGKSGESKVKGGQGAPAVVSPAELPGIVVDSATAKQVGAWKHSQYSKRYIGDGYLHDDNTGKGEKTLTFTPDLKRAGRYEIRLAYIHSPSRAERIPVTIFHADGETTVYVNEQEAPVIDSRFVSLGQFRFEANGFGYVLVSNEGTKGHVTADAVQFLAVDALPSVAVSSAAKEGSRVQGAQSAARLKDLEQKLKQLEESEPKRRTIISVKEKEKCEDIPIHIRGSVHSLGPVVPRGFLTVATGEPAPRVTSTSSGRREMAEWVASEANPLTSRVIVNRVWYWLMGEGIVRTVDNFGTTGEKPSHPELLDYLAMKFVAQGWSIKELIREIMFSHAYQLSAKADERMMRVDPENRLLCRMNRRRLSAEGIRDAMLLVSGELKRQSGGQTFPPNISADYGFQYAGTMRSVYIPVFRNALPDIFEVFDFAPSSMVTGRRNTSTVAPQALFFLNHPFVRERAAAAVARLCREEAAGQRIRTAYLRTLGRPPSEREAVLTAKALAGNEQDPSEAWTEIFQALFASLDFRYVN